MKPNAVALVARADKSRGQIARYLRDARYEVFECEELSIVTRFVGIVLVDDHDGGDAARAQVQLWIKPSKPLRVVVISAKPAAWRTMALSLSDQLVVLAAPSFAWEILDALRTLSPELPRRA